MGIGLKENPIDRQQPCATAQAKCQLPAERLVEKEAFQY